MGDTITVNGVDISSVIPKVFFLARPETQKTSHFASMSIPTDTIQTSTDILTKQKLRRIGTTALHTQKIPVMSSMDNADDLISLFHEQGHLNTDNKQHDSTSARRRLDNKSNDIGMELYNTLDKLQLRKKTDGATPHTTTIYEDLNTILDEERAASINAKALLSEKTMASTIFPSDPQCSKMTDFLHRQLITYANYAEGYFNKYLTKDQQAKLHQKTIL